MTAPTILVVEDVRITARCIETQLTEMGYAVAGLAATGEEAVRRAGELRPDLILMDVCLGAGIDGIEAAAQIRKQMDVPVVFLTANADAATLQRAKLTGPFGYVRKPHEDTDLRTAIEIGLHRHKLERQLRENEQWLAATLRSIGDGVIATDERGRVRLMNGRAEELTGWTQADAFGTAVQDVFQIVEEGSRRPVENPIFDALATGEPTTLAPATVLIDRNRGERFIEDRASPIRDVNGKVLGAVLVFRDVTECRRLRASIDVAKPDAGRSPMPVVSCPACASRITRPFPWKTPTYTCPHCGHLVTDRGPMSLHLREFTAGLTAATATEVGRIVPIINTALGTKLTREHFFALAVAALVEKYAPGLPKRDDASEESALNTCPHAGDREETGGAGTTTRIVPPRRPRP